MEDVDETPARTTSGRRIPAAATVMQEQAEKKWHGTREDAAQASALGREHTPALSATAPSNLQLQQKQT